MQANLERGQAASGARSASKFVAILAGAPLIALLLSASDPALAACGASAPAGTHPAAASGGSVHAATGIAAPSGGGGGGGGTLGCANGASVPLRGLPTAGSGRVVEAGVRRAAHASAHPRTAAARTASASAHVGSVKPHRP